MSNDSSSPLYIASTLSPVRSSSRSGQRDFKVIVIGSTGVGKTSLVRREVYGEFESNLQLSLGTERHVTKVEVGEETVELVVYDTVGQERFMTLSTILYRNVSAVLVCFDVSNRASFQSVDRWYADVERNAPKDALILLISTKIDLPRIVSAQECKEKAAQLGLHLVETSAKTGHNVTALFALVASALSGERKLRAQSSFPTAPPSPGLGPVLTPKIILEPETNRSYNHNTSSSCWMPYISSFSPVSGVSSNAPTRTSTPQIYQMMNPIPLPEDGLSLAEVLVEQANVRARIVAGGLRRRSTSENHHEVNNYHSERRTLSSSIATLGETLKEEDEDYRNNMNGYATSFIEENAEESLDTFRPCSLGCGALLEPGRKNHETEECWLRLVPCSLGCGMKFPLLDCVAHEREKCDLRTIRCECGERVKYIQLSEHRKSYDGNPISVWSKKDIVHFLMVVFPSRRLDFVNSIPTGFDGNDLLASHFQFLPSSSDRKVLENAIKKYSFNSSSITGSEYSSWEEEDISEQVVKKVQTDVTNSTRIVGGIGGSKFHMLPLHTSHFPMPVHSRFHPKENISSVQEVDAEVTFSNLWSSWVNDAKINLSSRKLKEHSHSGSFFDDDSTREVLVPLSLGSRTVAVKTIRFMDLELNSSNLVGSGSFGSVYLGRYRGAVVAVKHLHFQDVQERDLLREAAVMTSVSGHPHVLRFLGVCVDKPNICFISEALDCSLEEYFRIDKRNHTEPLKEIIRFAEEAASGIYHLHLEMVVHRDIAARNLLLDHGNPKRVKVCDFGLARVLPRRNPNLPMQIGSIPSPSIGGSLDLTGPLRWMSPESLRPVDGLTRFSYASDVYSFAITVWELLSRDVPYPVLAPHEAAIAVLLEDLRPPKAKMRPTVEHSLKTLFSQGDQRTLTRFVALMERAWDKDPVNRPTMREIVNELTAIHDLL